MVNKKNILIVGVVVSASIIATISFCRKVPNLYNDIQAVVDQMEKGKVIIRDERGYYNAIKEALYNYESTLDMTIDNYDKDTYNLDMVAKVLEDNSELKGSCINYNIKVYKTIISNKVTLTFNYYESKEILHNREKEVQGKISEIINKVTNSDMKDYEKEKAIHDYIANNSKYDSRLFSGNMPVESYNAYGILINGVGVCQGYAQAMDRLLKASGIESIMVTGEANDGKGWISHAWNIVKIGGEYYHLDLTWDDPLTEDNTNTVRYSYFNITDEKIEKNHRWKKENYPKCSSEKYSFSNLNLVEKDDNGNIITVVNNYDELFSAVKKELSKGNSTASFKIINFNDNKKSIENSIEKAYRALSKSGQYNYSYYKDDMMNCGYISVGFQ